MCIVSIPFLKFLFVDSDVRECSYYFLSYTSKKNPNCDTLLLSLLCVLLLYFCEVPAFNINHWNILHRLNAFVTIFFRISGNSELWKQTCALSFGMRFANSVASSPNEPIKIKCA